MSDWWSADPVAAPAGGIHPAHRDLAIRTIYGEAANEPENGQAAVAAVIKNRMEAGRYGGDSIPGVVLAKNQFEPWGNNDARARMMALKQDDPRYQKIGGIVDQIFGGQMEDPTNGATHFVAPQAQLALGRQMPSWAQGEGLPIGRHTFFAPEGRVQTASAQGEWWSNDPVAPPPPGQSAASVASAPPPLPADTGGRFTDNPGQNFRTAREGQSETVSSIPAFIRDVPKEAWAATRDAAAATNALLNPWSEGFQKGVEADKDKLIGTGPGSFLGTGKGLLSAASVPFAPIMGAARSLIGHPMSEIMPTLTSEQQDRLRQMGVPESSIPGRTVEENFQKARGDVDVAMSALAPRGGSPIGLRPPTVTPARPMPPALEANIAAQNIGVDLPKAIASDSPTTRFLGQVANKMPGGGPMQEGVATAIQQTGKAVADAAAKAGGVADPMAAGQGFQKGIETYFKPITKQRVSEAYDAVDTHISPNFTRPLTETQGAVADIVARRQASGEANPGKAVDTVLGGITRPGGLTYSGVKDLRTRVGEMLDAGIFPEGMSAHELRRVYSSLSDDLKATVQAGGGAPAMAAFDRANSMAKLVAGWKDEISKVLGSDRSGEGITGAILRMAGTSPAADLKALTMARAAVPKNAWQDVASTAISRLGLDKKGEFSPAIFLNDFSKLSDRGKQLLFGSVGSADVLPHLNNISTVSKKFVEAGKLANTSGTAGHSAAYTMAAGSGVGLLHGSFIEPVTAITAVVGNNLMARALSAPASAASVAAWARSYAAVVHTPTPATAASFKIASGNLANTLNAHLGAKFQAGDFVRAIQAGPQKAAADNEQQ